MMLGPPRGKKVRIANWIFASQCLVGHSSHVRFDNKDTHTHTHMHACEHRSIRVEHHRKGQRFSSHRWKTNKHFLGAPRVLLGAVGINEKHSLHTLGAD